MQVKTFLCIHVLNQYFIPLLAGLFLWSHPVFFTLWSFRACFWAPEIYFHVDEFTAVAFV